MTLAGKIFGAMVFSFLLLQTSCKDAIVDPLNKDPRTYTWTIDTLAFSGSFQTSMYDIWGSSPSDVYVVGHNDGGFGKMFHFNGQHWKPVGLNPIEGGTIAGPIDLAAVRGFSKDNIWAVGERIYVNPNRPPNYLDSTLIIRFDGSQWREDKIDEGRRLRAMWGSSSFDIWAGGWTNKLFHYDGVVWRSDSLPINSTFDDFFQVNAIEGNQFGEVFAIGNTHFNSIGKTIFYFFHKPAQGWNTVDSFVVQPGQVENKWGYGDLWTSPSGTLYSCGVGIYRRNAPSWQKLFDHSSFLTRIRGTHDSNIFVVGHYGAVLHFNGQGWHQYQQLADPNNALWGVWTDGKEVFIVGSTVTYPQSTLIFHGK